MARTKSTPRRRTTTRRRKTLRRRTPSVKRKRTPLNKTPAKRVKRDIGKSGSAAAHHAIRRNPFSNATSQPKIPDGELTSSLSRRLQHVVDVKNGTTGNDVLHLVCIPSMGIPITGFFTSHGDSHRGTSAYRPQFIGFSGQTVGLDPKPAGAAIWPPNAPLTDVMNITNLGSFAKWRIVSQGFTLDLTNTDEQNDGWWEACRFNWEQNANQLCLARLDGTAGIGQNDNPLGIAANEKFFTEVLQAMSVVEQPGYQTGLLKDISKKSFMLHPQSATHDPVVLPEFQRFALGNDGSQDGTYDATTETAELFQGSARANQIMKSTIDSNMDCLYIRLHCRTSGSGGSNFLLNLVQNLEVAFGPSSDFAAFQTKNIMDKNTKKVADAINNKSDAADTRMGT